HLAAKNDRLIDLEFACVCPQGVQVRAQTLVLFAYDQEPTGGIIDMVVHRERLENGAGIVLWCQTADGTQVSKAVGGLMQEVQIGVELEHAVDLVKWRHHKASILGSAAGHELFQVVFRIKEIEIAAGTGKIKKLPPPLVAGVHIILIDSLKELG